jgi:hypothetical protein
MARIGRYRPGLHAASTHDEGHSLGSHLQQGILYIKSWPPSPPSGYFTARVLALHELLQPARPKLCSADANLAELGLLWLPSGAEVQILDFPSLVPLGPMVLT